MLLRGGPGDGQVVTGGGETVVWQACLYQITSRSAASADATCGCTDTAPTAVSRTAVAPKTGANDASAERVFQLLREQRSAAMIGRIGTAMPCAGRRRRSTNTAIAPRHRWGPAA